MAWFAVEQKILTGRYKKRMYRKIILYNKYKVEEGEIYYIHIMYIGTHIHTIHAREECIQIATHILTHSYTYTHKKKENIYLQHSRVAQ